MATARLIIEGMSCGHCVAAVTRALESLPGVERATVDLSAARAEVAYDSSRLAPAALVAAVAEEGYDAALAAADSE